MGLPFENADYDEDRIGATNVTELTDTSIDNLQNNDILVYNSTTQKWENQVQSSTSVNDINEIGNVNITNVQNAQQLVYNSTTSKWENSTITDNNTDNLTDLTDTNLVSIANNETLIYNTNVNKWQNGNINLNYIGDVNISSVSNGEVLKYNSTTSKWENQDNTDNLNELTDVTITSSQNHQVLKYNNTAAVYQNAFVNLTELADTNITSLANNNILIYKTASQKWEAGNITYSETDPVFTASPANGITNTLINNWNDAYSWGNHNLQGYLTSYSETDPVFVASPANGITNTLINNWNNAYSWGNHAIQGYLKSYSETDPVFTAHTSYNITNGSGFLKNNGSGTWSYDNNTYLTSANIYQLGGLTWANVLDDEVIRRSSSTSAEGAGMKLRDAVTIAVPQNIYTKTISYFNRVSPTNIQFGAIDFQNSSLGYNQRIIPYNQLITNGTDGLYLNHSPLINSTNVSVGVNVQYPTQEFQVGTTMYVDDTTKRVGIGIQNPEENLEVDGSIQIDSANVGRLKFQKSGQNPHALGEIDAELDQTNGGQLEFYTKEDNGIVTKKMFINHLGSVNILTESGVFVIRNNSGSQQSQIYNSQFGDKDLTIDAYSNATAKGIRFFTNLNQRMRINFSGALGFGITSNFGNSGQILQSYGNVNTPNWTSTLTNMTTAGTFNINSVLQLGGSNGNSGQYLKSNGNAVPSWENLPAAGTVGTQTTSTTSTSSVYYPLVSSSAGGQTDETPIKHSYFEFHTSTLTLKLINPYTINTNNPFIAPSIEGTWGLNLISNVGGINFLADYNGSVPNALFFSHTNPNTFSPTSVRDGAYELGSAGRRWSNIWATNPMINTSDDRLKINEKPITGALKLINNLEYYEYDKVKTPDGTDVTHKERGVIAQHLLNTDLSYTLSGGKTETIKDPCSTETKYIPYGVKYNDLFVTLCSAVKELNTLVNTLEARIKTLETKP